MLRLPEKIDSELGNKEATTNPSISSSMRSSRDAG
jgi:hypothetical protein